MNDEYNNFGHELNKAIPEFKEIKAIEYYAPKEAVNPPSEVVRIPEASQDTYGMDRQPLTAEREHRSFEDKLDDRFRNTADGQQSPDINAGNVQGDVSTTTGTEAAGDAGASASTSGGASTSGASGASASGGASAGSAGTTVGASATAASMAGSVTVVACATVGVVALAGGTITAPEPNIVSAIYDVGTNYIKYEIDVEDLAPGINYKIKIYNNTFYEEYPITEPGLQKQIVTGLTPFRPYNIEIVGSSESIIETKFLTDTVVTSQLPQPQAVFDFTPVFDYTNLTYDINYDIYISDYYKTGSNHRIEITAGGEPVEDVPETVDEDNFFRGVIRGLVNLDVVEAIAYTTYCDEEIVIGEYNYSAKYPDDFIADNEKYEATYSLQQPSIEYSDLGFNLSIQTGFSSTDPRDGYIIDVYESEVSNNAETDDAASSTSTRTPIASYTFNKYEKPNDDGSIATLLVPGNVNGIDVYYTGTKTTNKTLKKYESKKIYSYQMDEARKDAPIYTSLDFTEDFDLSLDKYKLDYDLEINDVFKKYKDYEVIERVNDRVINEIELTSNKYTGTFESTVNGTTVYVSLYGKNEEDGEYELIKTYQHEVEHQEPFKNVQFVMLEDSYLVNLEYYKEDSSKEFNINITQNNLDGTKNVLNDTFTGIYSNESGSYSTDQARSVTLKDIKSFDISISSGDILVREYTILPNQETLVCGDISIDGNGNVTIPYEITLPDGATNVSEVFVSFEGAYDYVSDLNLSGEVTLENLNSNTLIPSAEVTYDLDGVEIRTRFEIESINLGAEYEVSYYASHYNSFYTTVNIKFDTTIDGKHVNMNVKPEVLQEGETQEFVPIDERTISAEYTTYNGFYVVNTVAVVENEETVNKLVYRITADGFDDTNVEHEVVVDSSFEAGSPTAGRVVNRGAWIDYVKTTNTDGTVNYYFNTYLSSNGTYYGRLEYSYLDGDTRKYLYSEMSSASALSLTNLVDREYDFKYSVYRLNNGLYYDTEPFNNIYSYTAVEVSASDAMVPNTATLVSGIIDRIDTVDIAFNLNYKNVDVSKPITVTYGDNTYEINIEPKDSLNVEVTLIDDYSYMYSLKSQDEKDEYAVLISGNENGYDTIMIEIKVTNLPDEIPSSATVTFNGGVNSFVTAYQTANGGVNDIINSESLSGEVEATIGTYTGVVDTSSYTTETEDAYGSLGNKVRIDVNNFNPTDSRDTLKAVAYVDGKEVSSAYLTYDYIDLYVSPAYPKFDVKIIEIKSQNVSSIMNLEFDDTTFKYQSHDLDSFEFEAQEIISDISVSEDEDMYVRVTPKEGLDFSDYYIKVEQFYKATAVSNVTSVLHTGEDGDTEVSFNKQYQTTKLVVNIYKKASYGDDILYGIHEIELNTEFGEIDIDANGNVTIPYEITLPEGASNIGDLSISFTGADDSVEGSDLEGVITLENLYSNEIIPQVSVSYELDGITISTSYSLATINLGAEYEVSYYASHYNSFYTTANIRFETTIDGKHVNMNVKPEVLQEGETQEFVPIDERTISAEYTTYNGFYVVNTVAVVENEETVNKLVYRITADGFDDTNVEHEVVVDSSFEAGSPTAGRVVNRGAWIDYVKTTNTDGTVNYYFNTYLSSNGTYYGRLEYSYLDGDTRKYLYSEMSSASALSLTNLVDREYDFKYSVYRLSDGVYYDTEPFNDVYSYTAVEVSASDAMNLNNATVITGIVDRTKTADISFSLDYKNVDISKPITVTYGDNTYTINIEAKDSANVEVTELDEYSYMYGWQSQDEKVKYAVLISGDENGYNTIMIEVVTTNVAAGITTATVTYNGGVNSFITTYQTANGGVNDIINSESLSGEVEATIGAYTGVVDTSNYTTETEDAYGSLENKVRINIENFNPTDSRDTLKAVAYVDGKEVSSAYLTYDYIDLYVSPAYPNFDVKIVEVKSQSLTSLIGIEFDNTSVEYQSHDLDSFEFNVQEIISDLSISEDGDMIVRVTPASGLDFTDYYVKVEQFYKATAASNITSTLHTGSDGGTEVSFDKQYQTTKLIVNIYKKASYGDDILYNIYEIELDAEIGEYTYNDGDDSISLPYELNIPQAAIINTSQSEVVYSSPETLSRSGNITIDTLDSNEIELYFNVSYTLNNVNVSYTFTKSHELHGEVNLDYEIYSLFSNSSYGSFSLDYDGAKYDEDTQTIYIKNTTDNKYYDEDGNELQNPNTVDDKYYGNTIYYLKGSVTETIGNFTISNPVYQVNVKKAGGTVVNQSTGELYSSSSYMTVNPNVLLDSFIIDVDGQNTTGIYLTFFHTNVGNEYYDYQVNGINRCELEFDILGNGSVLLTKSIEFTEPSKKTIPDENAFSVNRSTVNSTVTSNQDGTINMTIDTGFDSTAYPNYAYKVELHEKLSYNGYTHEKLYESDYSTSSSVSFSNVKNTNYEVYVTVYNVQDGNYIKYESYNIGRANSPIEDTDWKYDSSAGTYSNIIYIDTNYINPDYLDGSKLLSFKTGTIDLSSTASQSVSSNTVLVEDQGSGIYKITITASNYNDPRGDLVIEQGNAIIDYTEVTYSI